MSETTHKRFFSNTIYGGLTRDTLCDAYKLAGGQIVQAIVNHAMVLDITKFAGPLANWDKLIEQATITCSIEGVRFLITKDREAVPNDHILLLTVDGCLYDIDFA